MQQIAVQHLISTVGCTNKQLGINALILIPANGNFVRFSRVPNNKGCLQRCVPPHDPKGRVACETLVTTGVAVVAGEITTSAHVDYDELVRGTIRGVGYDRAKYGYDADTCAVMCTVKRQSPDIAMGVDTGGAGDQGLMFGFACDETEEWMPMPIQLAHRLTQRLSEIRKANKVDFLRPDGKSQVTIEYRDGRQ